MCAIVHSKHLLCCDPVTSFSRSREVKLLNEINKMCYISFNIGSMDEVLPLTYSKVDMENLEVHSDLTSDLCLLVIFA